MENFIEIIAEQTMVVAIQSENCGNDTIRTIT